MGRKGSSKWNFCKNQKSRKFSKKKLQLEKFFCRPNRRGDTCISKKGWWIFGLGGGLQKMSHKLILVQIHSRSIINRQIAYYIWCNWKLIFALIRLHHWLAIDLIIWIRNDLRPKFRYVQIWGRGNFFSFFEPIWGEFKLV